MERAGLLQPRAQHAPLRAGGGRALRWRLPAHRRRARDPTRNRTLHRCGDCGLLFRRARGHPRRQREARADARARFRRRHVVVGAGARAVGPRHATAAVGRPARGGGALHAGPDGPGRHGLPAAQAQLHDLPGERELRGPAPGRARALPGEDAQAQAQRPVAVGAAGARRARARVAGEAARQGHLGGAALPAGVRQPRRPARGPAVGCGA
ncbi:hypothetical protein D9M69_573370 [compost metagenome]